MAFSYDDSPEARTVLHDVSCHPEAPRAPSCACPVGQDHHREPHGALLGRERRQRRVGGHDVREFTCDSLLANFSMVFQNVYLFNDTVEANIAFGCPGASHDEVVAAAKRACCHGFIEELPQGYDTVVGEGGSSLSGGQKQRISIARALLKDAPIVVLDEATASVDPENEQLIQQAIGQLTAGKTVVVIAHRLATVEASDQILVVDGGTVAQRGTHDQLMAEGGTYRRFVEIRRRAEGWRIASDDAVAPAPAEDAPMPAAS
ncbi:MAG: ABC transporter ATP-binding protein [Eggerthella lenta]